MLDRWSEEEAARFVERYGEKWGVDLALRTYSSQLLGAEEGLVLHGGGNTSVKGFHRNILGESIPAVYVKASGFDMASIEPEGHPGLDLTYLRRLRALNELSDEQMQSEFRTHLLDADAPMPSLETLVHAFLSPKFIDHTHADAILTLTNQPDGKKWILEALGEGVIVLDYVRPGFRLANATAKAFEAAPGSRAMVWMRHGILTWGEKARESYGRMIELVTGAEDFIRKCASRPLSVQVSTPIPEAMSRLMRVAPVLRGLLAEPSGDPDQPFRRVILQPLVSRETLDFVNSDRAREIALTPPLTSDHLIRTKPWPLWVDAPAFEDSTKLREQLSGAIEKYAAAYRAYVERHQALMPPGVAPLDPLPRVVLIPGLGAICAGPDARAARIARDITAHTLAVKSKIAAMGSYEGLPENELFEMEYHTFQQAKLGAKAEPPLGRRTALITGAAGAIGSAIAEELLANGCHVAVTDLAAEALDNLAAELRVADCERVLAVPMDVTDAASVSKAFEVIVQTWGGLDLLVLNAGIAHAAPLEKLDPEVFRRLERVNTEGTLLPLAEAARHFRAQGTGGDVVMISTKNVFSPGAQFGAYSATKAAAHQLARIAALELAELGVRVNMVAPDAIFSHGGRKSGLWQEVGPERMRARGLNEEGLEEYYRQRNLLKVTVTARPVARAVLFFATRQTPTTGATLPVDGGLPDATPR
jgi:rhamnose utilization protein RhaD (predicted bifunctional aldolase and dehydrogenase)/NAD(P)-dependent dehydrogenase (short-subunit alcohol dehydrogenase family)